MTLLAVERIKLFTTRSPWWCMVLALVLTVGFSAMLSAIPGGDFQMSVSTSQAGYQFGMVVIMVMATLAVTTEYRFGTIRTSFQAVPNRVAVLLAKATVVALLAGVVGEVTAFASWAMAKAIRPGPLMALDSAQTWRNVAGVGLVYVVAAVIAVAVGILIRQSAGAISILLVYTLLVENLIRIVPKVGDKIHNWMPFNMADNFINAGAPLSNGRSVPTTMPLGPWPSLAYVAGIAIVLLVISLVVVRQRDA
jgi:ABC-2 type transport system permease protein